MDNAAGDGDVFGWTVDAQTIGVLAGLEGDGVVAVIEIAIGDSDIAGGIDINSTGESSGECFNVYIADLCVLAIEEVNRPERRADDMNALDENIFAFHGADESGA